MFYYIEEDVLPIAWVRAAVLPGGVKMYKVIQVRPMADYHLWLLFNDGTEGTVNLSHLAGKGVFSEWDDHDNFNKVTIGESGELVWGDRIDLCPDSLFMELTKKHPEDLFPRLKMELSHA